MANVDLHESDATSDLRSTARSGRERSRLVAGLAKALPAGRRRLAALLLFSDVVVFFATTLVVDGLIWALSALTGAALTPLPIFTGVAVYVAASALFSLLTRTGVTRWDRVRRRVQAIAAFTVAMALILGFDAPLAPALPALALTAPALLALSHFSELLLRRVSWLQSSWRRSAEVLSPEADSLAAALREHPESILEPRIASPDNGFVERPDIVILSDGAGADWRLDDAPAPMLVLAHAEPGPARAKPDDADKTSPRLRFGVSPLHDPKALRIKRAIDLPIALAAGLLAAPLIAVMALFIAILDPGSPFYTQVRIGKNGKPFKILKLRSMYRDSQPRLERHLAENPEAAEEWARYFKLRDDPRILPVIGSFVRRSSIDELPQIWNILIGDMSLVGPRPFPQYHLSSFDETFQAVRASVTPGLTGYWQVTERSDGDLAAQQECDLFYIRNWSIWLDIYLLLQTAPAVLLGKGAR